MSNPAFPDIPVIPFEGAASRNPLAFKHYNADEEVGGKAMKDHLRFGIAYWHTLRNPLGDPFGPGTLPAGGVPQPWRRTPELSGRLQPPGRRNTLAGDG